MARRDYRKGALPFEFIPIPKAVLAMPDFIGLPSGAKVLMLDLAAQYTGKNNGRLCPAWEVMKRSGWVSKGTLQRARDALLEMPFVVHTRKGHPPRTVDWIAFTWWKLDYEKSMDAWIDPRGFPYLNFNFIRPIVKCTGSTGEKQVLSPRNEGVSTVKVIPRPPEMRERETLQ